MKGPELTTPTPVEIAYKNVYGYYPYDNNFLKMFKKGFEEGVKHVSNLDETYSPDY